MTWIIEPRQQLLAYCCDLEARKRLGVVLCVPTDRRESGIICCDEATAVEWARGLAELTTKATSPELGGWDIEHALPKLALAACWAAFKVWHPYKLHTEAGPVDDLLKNCDAFLANPTDERRAACEIPSPSCQPEWSWGLSREICYGGPAGGMVDAYTEDIFADAADEDGVGLDKIRASVLKAVRLW